MAYDLRPFGDAVRNIDGKAALVMVCGGVLAGALFGESADEKLAKKQKKLDALASWGSWAHQNCAQPKAGEPLYVCSDGRRFYAMSAADLEASRQCVENIKACERVPDPPAMLPALASR